jgi:Ala-tRNA(Pro) deacylase
MRQSSDEFVRMTADRLVLGGFSEIPRRLIHCLNSHRVRYEIIHEPEGSSSSIKSSALLVTACVVNARNRRVLIVIPANRQVDLKKVRALLGIPVRLETEDEFKWLFPDCALGAVPPFGNLYGLPTYTDGSLAKSPDIVFAAGTTADRIKLAWGTYREIVKPVLGGVMVTAKRQA